MKLTDLKTLISCMIDAYEGDRDDTELMNTKCTFRQVADTNVMNLKTVLKAIDEVNEFN